MQSLTSWFLVDSWQILAKSWHIFCKFGTEINDNSIKNLAKWCPMLFRAINESFFKIDLRTQKNIPNASQIDENNAQER